MYIQRIYHLNKELGPIEIMIRWLRSVVRNRFNLWTLMPILSRLKKQVLIHCIPIQGSIGVFYGETVFADSLSRCIDRLEGGTGIQIDASKVELSDSSRYTDNDLEKLLNLYLPIGTHEKAYPNLIYKKEGKRAVSAIIIADSYYSNLYFNTSFHTDYFAQGSAYWYYCTTQHPGNSSLTDEQIRFGIEDTEYVIVMMADYTFPYILPKTAEKLYQSCFGMDDEAFEKRSKPRFKKLKIRQNGISK